jgi:hypothetical protein
VVETRRTHKSIHERATCVNVTMIDEGRDDGKERWGYVLVSTQCLEERVSFLHVHDLNLSTERCMSLARKEAR